MAFELHCTESESLTYYVILLVAGRSQEFKLRSYRKKTVYLKIDRFISLVELPFVDYALPSEYVCQLYPVCSLYGLYIVYYL